MIKEVHARVYNLPPPPPLERSEPVRRGEKPEARSQRPEPEVRPAHAEVPPKAHCETVPVRQAEGRLPSPQEERWAGVPSPTMGR